MATEPHKLQPDPPEGDRATIERELSRQKGGAKALSETEGKDAGKDK